MVSHDIFISYSSKDRLIADAICHGLEVSQIRCWIAPRDVLPGIQYGEALIEALNSSRIFLQVLSGHSNSSPQVLREVERAARKKLLDEEARKRNAEDANKNVWGRVTR